MSQDEEETTANGPQALQVVQRLADVLDDNDTLTSLVLKQCDVDDDGIAALATATVALP